MHSHVLRLSGVVWAPSTRSTSGSGEALESLEPRHAGGLELRTDSVATGADTLICVRLDAVRPASRQTCDVICSAACSSSESAMSEERWELRGAVPGVIGGACHAGGIHYAG